MMLPNDIRRTGVNAINMLAQKGCEPIEATATPIPVITINYPTVSMIESGQLLQERKDGERRSSYITRFNGCIVRWHESNEVEQAAELVESLNPYAPEQIAFWPKNL